MIDPNSSDPSSATPEFTSEPLYGIPQTGQTGTTGHQTGQTGYSVPSPTPLETIPGSAAPSRTNELSVYTPPCTTTVAGGP